MVGPKGWKGKVPTTSLSLALLAAGSLFGGCPCRHC